MIQILAGNLLTWYGTLCFLQKLRRKLLNLNKNRYGECMNKAGDKGKT
jgi:hypothetical protein